MTDTPEKRCGFVAIVGAPNAGKSTLLNKLVGAKITIVSPKVQTTRSCVSGIVIEDQSQIVFVDTPGIFVPKKRLERAMVKAAWTSTRATDLIAVIVDTAAKNLTETYKIFDHLLKTEQTPIVLLNKIDRASPKKVAEIEEHLRQNYKIDQVFGISALKGTHIQDLRSHLAARMPKGPWHYPEDQISNLPQRLMAAEITREKVFLNLHQELPYAIAVETEEWEEFDNGDLKIQQVIYVQKTGQKAIALGKGGQKIKRIGELARKELTILFGRKIHLFLYVKVKEDWADRPGHYETIGLEFKV